MSDVPGAEGEPGVSSLLLFAWLCPQNPSWREPGEAATHVPVRTPGEDGAAGASAQRSGRSCPALALGQEAAGCPASAL